MNRPVVIGTIAILCALIASCKKDDPEDMAADPGGGISTGQQDTVYSDVLNILDGSGNAIEMEGYLTPEFCKFTADEADGAWIVQVQRPTRVPFVVRVRSDHSIAWIRSLGMTNSTPLGVMPVSDGAILFLRNSLLSKTILVKMDQAGSKVWEKSSDLFMQSFNAEKVFITKRSNGNMLLSSETNLVEFSASGEVVGSHVMSKSISLTIEHDGHYYCFARNSAGMNYDVFKLDPQLDLAASVTIEVVNQTQNLKGVHVSDDGRIIAFFNVDRGQEGMHNRIYILDGDLQGEEVKKGVLSADGLDYMFTELQPGSARLPSGEYGFGIFRSRGNLGNQNLGYHMIVFGNDAGYAVPYDQTALFGTGGVYNDGSRENAGIFTLSTTSVLLSYPVSNLGDCAGPVTYKLSTLPNDDYVYSDPQISVSAGTITTSPSEETALSDYTVRDNGLSFCIQ